VEQGARTEWGVRGGERDERADMRIVTVSVSANSAEEPGPTMSPHLKSQRNQEPRFRETVIDHDRWKPICSEPFSVASIGDSPSSISKRR